MKQETTKLKQETTQLKQETTQLKQETTQLKQETTQLKQETNNFNIGIKMVDIYIIILAIILILTIIVSSLQNKLKNYKKNNLSTEEYNDLTDKQQEIYNITLLKYNLIIVFSMLIGYQLYQVNFFSKLFTSLLKNNIDLSSIIQSVKPEQDSIYDILEEKLDKNDFQSFKDLSKEITFPSMKNFLDLYFNYLDYFCTNNNEYDR